jgi:sugar/nucleoside kinase (ribokinase family)
MRLTTLGDLLLDVIVRLDTPLVPGDDRPAVTYTGAGGQAANVAAWACELGATARVVAKRGVDPAGELVLRELTASGVEVAGPSGGRSGVVVSIAADGDRSMLSDRGAGPSLSPDELEDSWFDCDVLHISGYALHREPMASAAAKAAATARAQGARISVDASAWTLIDDPFRRRIAELSPDLVFATEEERNALGEQPSSWIIKRGSAGIVVDGAAYPAVPVEVVDATGAGDALAAGFLVGGPQLGLEAAARCCAKLGSLP